MLSNRHTDIQTKYCNPHCACAPRDNYFQCRGTVGITQHSQQQKEAVGREKLFSTPGSVLVRTTVLVSKQVWREVAERQQKQLNTGVSLRRPCAWQVLFLEDVLPLHMDLIRIVCESEARFKFLLY